MLVQSQIVALLNELLNQTAKLRKGGAQAVYFCPECHHYKRKLEINLETGQWHCWTCNIKGSYLGSFLSKVKASNSASPKGRFRRSSLINIGQPSSICWPRGFRSAKLPSISAILIHAGSTPMSTNAVYDHRRRVAPMLISRAQLSTSQAELKHERPEQPCATFSSS